MELEDDIEKGVLEYLHLEYGESPEDEDSLKLSDLKYEGEYILEGIPTYFWSYPTNSPCWAIVKPYDDAYCFDMTTTSPVELQHA